MIWSAQSAISVSFYSSIAQSVEHAAVNRAVVGSSPTRGVLFIFLQGPMVKRLRHRPFTAVTRVRISLGSLWRRSQVVRHGSATPSPPVRIRSSPLMNLEGLNLQGFLLFLKNRSMYYLYIQDHHKIEEIHKSAKNLHKSAKSAKTT